MRGASLPTWTRHDTTQTTTHPNGLHGYGIIYFTCTINLSQNVGIIFHTWSIYIYTRIHMGYRTHGLYVIPVLITGWQDARAKSKARRGPSWTPWTRDLRRSWGKLGGEKLPGPRNVERDPNSRNVSFQVIQAVTFSSPIVGGHFFTPSKGHLTIPKRSLWITRFPKLLIESKEI